METREDGKKQKAYVAITSSTSYFHSLSSCKGGGERAREGEKEGGWGGDKKEDSSHLKKYTENSVKSMHTC